MNSNRRNGGNTMNGIRNQIKGLARGQRGITGLETAIVLIAFVVVSSVFAFAALSTGLFSSDKSKETIQAGLSEARGTLEVRGGVTATATLTAVVGEAVGTGDGADVTWSMANSPIIPGSQTVNVNAVAQTYGTQYTMNFDTGVATFVTAPGNGLAITASYTYYLVTAVKLNVTNAAGGQPVDMTAGETIINYMDPDSLALNINNYTLTKLGSADADNLLEATEIFEITVNTSTYGLTDGDEFVIQVKPPTGAVVNVSRTFSATIAAVMNLN